MIYTPILAVETGSKIKWTLKVLNKIAHPAILEPATITPHNLERLRRNVNQPRHVLFIMKRKTFAEDSAVVVISAHGYRSTMAFPSAQDRRQVSQTVCLFS